MNKTGYIVIGVLVLLLGGVFLLTGGDDSNRSGVVNNVEKAKPGAVSLSEICTWTDDRSNVTEYLYEHKTYVESVAIENPSSIEYLINTQSKQGANIKTEQYWWTTDSRGAGTHSVSVIDESEPNDFENREIMHGVTKSILNKTCKSWDVDESVFEAPSAVTFKEV